MVSLFKSCISKTCCNKAKIVSNINLSFKKVQIWSPSSCFEWLFLKLTIVQRMWTPGEAFVEMIKGVTQTTFGQLDYYFHWFRRSSILLLFFVVPVKVWSWNVFTDFVWPNLITIYWRWEWQSPYISIEVYL